MTNGTMDTANCGGLEDRMSILNGVMNECTGYIKIQIEVSNKPYKCKYAKGIQKSRWCYKVCPNEASDITHLLELILLKVVVAQTNPAPFCSWMTCLVTPKQKLCNKRKTNGCKKLSKEFTLPVSLFEGTSLGPAPCLISSETKIHTEK